MSATAIDTASAPEEAIIDDSSISPTRADKNILEKRLAHRPDVQDLKNRNILMDTNAAPALQSVQHELERQKATDNLRKGLEQRPEREVLIERNILPDSTAAPALQGHQRELEKHMRRDSLENHLKQRPKPEELIKEGILEEGEDPTKA